MRNVSPALQSFLQTRQPCWVADCFSIALADGATVLNWTSFDRNLSAGITTYAALGPLINRSRMTMRNTAEVPELEVTIAALDSVIVKGISLKTAVHNGLFDGGRLSLYRAWMPEPGDTSLGLVLMFNGRLSQATITAPTVQFTVKGDNVLMNQQAPRNLYQTTCLHTFCDAGCTLLGANYTVGFSVGAFPTTTKIPWGTAPANPGLYVLGALTFTSGICVGQVRTIRNADATGVYLTYPTYGLPSPGDSFTALMGCARTLKACQSHVDKNGNAVNNQQHFRGEPWVPQAEYGV